MTDMTHITFPYHPRDLPEKPDSSDQYDDLKCTPLPDQVAQGSAF